MRAPTKRPASTSSSPESAVCTMRRAYLSRHSPQFDGAGRGHTKRNEDAGAVEPFDTRRKTVECPHVAARDDAPGHTIEDEELARDAREYDAARQQHNTR